jgi:hypothetical protein
MCIYATAVSRLLITCQINALGISPGSISPPLRLGIIYVVFRLKNITSFIDPRSAIGVYKAASYGVANPSTNSRMLGWPRSERIVSRHRAVLGGSKWHILIFLRRRMRFVALCSTTSNAVVVCAADLAEALD